MKWILTAISVALMVNHGGLSVAAAEDYSHEIGLAERIGRLIYEKDRAAWMATDILVAKQGISTGIIGWVTVEQDSSLLVQFVGGEPESPCVLFEVPVSDVAGDLIKKENCVPLGEDSAAMFRARQTALAALTSPCSERYNTVVLPSSPANEDRWLVYLLAATTRPGEIVVGGHFRVLVSTDGRSVREYEPLTKSCLTLPPPSEQDAVAAVVSHVLTNTPIETHVFLSLSHEKPLYVVTDQAMWAVEGGEIRLLMDGEEWESYQEKAKGTQQ